MKFWKSDEKKKIHETDENQQAYLFGSLN